MLARGNKTQSVPWHEQAGLIKQVLDRGHATESLDESRTHPTRPLAKCLDVLKVIASWLLALHEFALYITAREYRVCKRCEFLQMKWWWW
jgi:hypothetical protein